MCKFCTNTDDSETIYGEEYDIFGTEMSPSMFLDSNEKDMVFMIGDSTVLTAKIKYCPLCGRKLD